MTLEDFLTRFPLFSEVDTSVVTAELDAADLIFTSAKFPSDSIRDGLIGYYVAHTLAMDYEHQLLLAAKVRGIEASDNISGISGGRYDSNRFFDRSQYGRKFAQLLRRYEGTSMFSGSYSFL